MYTYEIFLLDIPFKSCVLAMTILNFSGVIDPAELYSKTISQANASLTRY
jgi:hypothetical protein